MNFGMIETLESRRMLSAAAPWTWGVEPTAPAAIHAALKATRPPTVTLKARPIVTAVSSYTFKVIYHSIAGVSAATIATGNVSVTGPNGYAATPTLVSHTPAGNARTIVASYLVTPPSGTTFTAAADGTYIVTLAAGSVTDVNNLSAATPVVIGSFRTQIRILPPPTGKLTAAAITAATSSYAVRVVYHCTTLINASTIATGNLSVAGPNGYQSTPTLVSITPARNAATITAVYSVPPPAGGTFAAASNGAYTVSLAAASVANLGGSTAAAMPLGTFTVNIPGPALTLPNMVGVYNGTNIVPSAGSYHYAQLTVASEDPLGNISGSWVTDVGVTFNFTGTVAADGTFNYTFATPANTNHATGPVTGSGTGSGAGSGSLSFNFTATSAGFSAPGTMNVTKA